MNFTYLAVYVLYADIDVNYRLAVSTLQISELSAT